MSSVMDYDVLVVGYGLAGQSVASLLGSLGHRVRVVERWETLYGMSRTISFDGEAQRVVQASGELDDAMSERSEFLHSQVFDGDQNLLIDMDFTGQQICGFHARVSFYQPLVEAAMDRRVRDTGVEVTQGWEVVDLHQDDDRVTVVIQERVDDDGAGPNSSPPARETITARYVIGADGARSSVRELLGVTREDYDFDNAYLSVDVKRLRPIESIPAHTVISISDPVRGTSIIPFGNDRIRFEFAVNPDDDNSALLTPDAGYEMMAAVWDITREDVEIYRQVIYPFAGKVADDWRVGRVLLAGDAAHVMPPFLGQGACSALRDSISLAWELDLVLRGISDDALLDQYQAERKPHAAYYVHGSCEIGRIALDPERAAQQNAAMRELGGDVTLPPPLEVGYDHGVLHRTDGELAALAGTLSTQGRVAIGGREGLFDDVVGRGFALVGWQHDPTKALDDEQRAFLEAIGCRIVILSPRGSADVAQTLDDRYERFFAETGVVSYLARPDFRLFAGFASPDAVPEAIDDLRGQLHIVSDVATRTAQGRA